MAGTESYFRLKFNEKNPVIIGMWIRAPGGAAWMQKRRVDSRWFFSDNRCLRYRVVQEGCYMSCWHRACRGVEKEGVLAFAFLEVNQ